MAYNAPILRTRAPVAVVSDDQTIALREAGSAKLRHRLTGHEGAVVAATFSPDSKSLATASHDGSVKLWVWKADGRS